MLAVQLVGPRGLCGCAFDSFGAMWLLQFSASCQAHVAVAVASGAGRSSGCAEHEKKLKLMFAGLALVAGHLAVGIGICILSQPRMLIVMEVKETVVYGA